MSIEITIRNKAPSPDLIRGLIRTTYMKERLSRPSLNGAMDFKPHLPEEDQRWTRGLPDTCQYVGKTNDENKHVVLREAVQWLWYNENKKRVPGRTKKEYDDWFNSMTTGDRWTTNDWGSNGRNPCRVYPTNKNVDAEDMRYFTLFTGLTVVEIIGARQYFGGSWKIPFRCIDASKIQYLDADKNPDDLLEWSYEKMPLCWYEPMNSVRIPLLDSTGKKWLHGVPKYIENGYERFPQYDNRSITPILMPNTNVAWVDENDVIILQPGQTVPTFNM